jgi:UDP-4-amino-4,6-dideoxy-N-acetyl-beta-L-altrosamine transaminase
MIPYGKHEINQQDIDSVVKVLKSDFITQGPLVPKFETKVCSYSGAKYAVAVNSATSALHLACLSLNLGHGDWLWTSPITFVASANCGLYCGAQIDFVDIDPNTHNISIEALTYKLKNAEIEGKLPKILIPVHFSGNPCDMLSIYNLSVRYGFQIIEDASHAIGAKYKDNKIGNCKYSDITVFSFHPVKMITTGEGGMALTNDKSLARRMERLRSHGITKDIHEMKSEDCGPWYYEQIELGFNYRMTDIQAALGISQIERLDYYVKKRNLLADRYCKLLADMPLSLTEISVDSYSSMHIFVVTLELKKIKKSYKDFFNSMRHNGVGVMLHYIPVHLQPFYKAMGFKAGDFPTSENYYSKALTLPLFPTMKFEEQDKVIRAVIKSASN